jgi:hypothetical protein
MAKKSGIYIYKHKTKLLVYVGQSVDLDRRYESHLSHWYRGNIAWRNINTGELQTGETLDFLIRDGKAEPFENYDYIPKPLNENEINNKSKEYIKNLLLKLETDESEYYLNNKYELLNKYKKSK